MDSSTKPTFYFIHGAMNGSTLWDSLRVALKEHDYPTTVVELPSNDPPEPLTGFEPDVEEIRKGVTSLVEDGKHLIVIMHSYGGFPGSEALKGLSKKEREDEGKAGGVVRLVYIMSFMLPEGAELLPKGTRDLLPPFILYNEKARTNYIAPDSAVEYWYHDLPTEEASYWAGKTKTHSLDVFWSTTTYAAWKHIPTTFVKCLDDKTVPLEYVDMQLEMVRNSVPTGLDRIEIINSGHFPFLSKVQDVATILRRAAGEDI